MSTLNRVILIGNLGQDPEVKHLDSGSVVAKFTVATSESYKDKSGNKVTNTEWHSIELWDGIAKVAEQYLKKGAKVAIEGKIKTDSWTNEAGEKRYATKIRATSMVMLGGGSGERSESDVPASNPMGSPTENSSGIDFSGADEDLPF